MAYPVLTFGEQLSLANGTLAADLAGATLHLFTAVSSPLSINSLPTDFTEPVYTGYSPLAPGAWSVAYRDLNGQAALTMPMQTFYGPANGGGPTILGVYLLAGSGSGSGGSGGTSPRLIAAAQFDNPFPLVDALTQLGVNWQMGPAGNGWVTTEGSSLP
jgi:hypothetical protein